MPARPNVPQRTSLAFKTSDGQDTALFVAVPEVLQSGRGREAGADAEGAAGQHFAGLQEGRKGRTAAAAVKRCKIKLHRARSPKWLANAQDFLASLKATDIATRSLGVAAI